MALVLTRISVNQMIGGDLNSGSGEELNRHPSGLQGPLHRIA